MPVFNDNGISFSNIQKPNLYTSGNKISGNQYNIDENGEIVHSISNYIINAIDIDWNNARIPGIEDTIQSTSKLLQLIGLLYNSNTSITDLVNDLNSKVKNFENQQIPSNIEEQLTALSNRITKFENQQIPSNIEEQLAALNARIDEYHLDYTFEYDLINVTKTGGPNTMRKNDVITLNFAISSIGYIFPNEIEVEGADYTYNTNGTVIISNPTDKHIIIKIYANDKRQCVFNIPTISNLSCELLSTKTTFTVGEAFNIKFTLTGDSNSWKLPLNKSKITGDKCSVEEYDPSSGIVKLVCLGTGNMNITTSAQQRYKFNITTLTNLRCELVDAVNVYDANDIVTIKLVLTGDSNSWKLPLNKSNITGRNCTIKDYNPSTGDATLICSGTGDMSITASAQQRYKLDITHSSLTNLGCELIGNNVFDTNDIVNIRITITGDTDLWGLPSSISVQNCTVQEYSSSNGTAKLKCSGTGNMTITATAKDVAIYYFAVALESNSIFTRGNNTITNCDLTRLETIQGRMKATGVCPIDFASGFTADNSVDAEGQYVWFILPSKYFNKSNYNFINGSNKYLLKQSNIQDLTIDTKIKDCVDISGKVQYTLVCVSNNGLTGKQEFKKI